MEHVNHFAEKTMIVEMEKFVKDKFVQPDVDPIPDVPIACRVKIRSASTPAKDQPFVERMQFAKCQIIKSSARV